MEHPQVSMSLSLDQPIRVVQPVELVIMSGSEEVLFLTYGACYC